MIPSAARLGSGVCHSFGPRQAVAAAVPVAVASQRSSSHQLPLPTATKPHRTRSPAPSPPFSLLQRSSLHTQSPRRSGAAAAASNPAMAFPCLDAIESRTAKLGAAAEARAATTATAAAPTSWSDTSGPEPSYTIGATLDYHCREPLLLDWGGILPEFHIAYETWGAPNADRSNVVLLHTGLSASSHAHSTESNPQPGWWERFIGPGCALDTDKYFVICTNVIGGCYGSTGPASIDPADGQRYATRFPILTISDMVRAQFRLLDSLGVQRLHASVGSSMGGMQSLAAATLFPERVNRVVSISGCARSHPYSIAMRHTQRQVLMMDPNWNRGFYYNDSSDVDAEGNGNGNGNGNGRKRVPPHAGMKLAREIATVTYRSGPEWEQRFGRRRADPTKPPALCPDFLIETYLDHAGEKFCLTYDANSLLYVSKAMDLFDLSAESQTASSQRRAERERRLLTEGQGQIPSPEEAAACTLTLPDAPYEEQHGREESGSGLGAIEGLEAGSPLPKQQQQQQQPHTQPPEDLVRGLAVLRDHPTLVMGVASDILFPAWQQREVADALRLSGNSHVTHIELSEDHSLFGHDTFLLDLENIGANIKNFLG